MALGEQTTDPAAQTTAKFMMPHCRVWKNEDHHGHVLLLPLQSVIT